MEENEELIVHNELELSNIGDSPHEEQAQTDFDVTPNPAPAFDLASVPQTDMDLGEAAGPEDRPVPQTDLGLTEDSLAAGYTPEGEVNPETSLGRERKPRIDARKYVKEGEHVVTIGNTPGYVSEEEKAREDMLDMVESFKGGRILTDRLMGVERTNISTEPVAVLHHGAFKIIIPASDMITLPDDLHGRSPDDAYYSLLHRRMGAEIDYIIKAISPDDPVAVASRKDAMAIKRKQFYFTRDRAGNNLLYEDVCAEARVTCVFGSGIVVDLFGVETFIPLRELSWQRLTSAVGKFKPGDRVVVRIQELDRSDREHLHVRSSVRLAMTNPYRDALRKYTVNCCYVGTVSHIDTTGIYVSMEGIDCLCTFPPRGRPPIGTRVTVYLLGKDEEACRMWGTIIHASVPLLD